MITTLNYDAIISKLKEKGFSDSDIEDKIKKKMEQLSGLISKEGAAHIVANEVGVKVFEDVGEIKVEKARNGMRNVNLNVKVTANYGIKEFKTEKREGKVGSFLAGDDTGILRVVLWDDAHLSLMENAKENVVVRVENGYIKENNGYKEIHLNNNSKLVLSPEGVEIGEVKIGFNGMNGSQNFSEKEIKDLGVNDRVAIKGTVVQVFDPRFYEVCPDCGKRTKGENGVFKCSEHGNINPGFSYVANCVLDDGSESIRIVFFREQVEKLFEVGKEGVLKIKENPGEFENIKNKILGKQVKINGRVNKNEMFDRLEFVASSVDELDPDELLKSM